MPPYSMKGLKRDDADSKGQSYGCERVGNVASSPLDDFRPHKIMERAARVEFASSGWRPEAPAAIPCWPFTLAGVTGFEPA